MELGTDRFDFADVTIDELIDQLPSEDLDDFQLLYREFFFRFCFGGSCFFDDLVLFRHFYFQGADHVHKTIDDASADLVVTTAAARIGIGPYYLLILDM